MHPGERLLRQLEVGQNKQPHLNKTFDISRLDVISFY